MQAPPEQEGHFSIYFEKLDSLLVNTLSPKCFLCGELLDTSDLKCVVVRSLEVLRFDTECWDQFIVGLFMFNQNMESMSPLMNNIQ